MLFFGGMVDMICLCLQLKDVFVLFFVEVVFLSVMSCDYHES